MTAGKLEVREQLSFMDRLDVGYGLELDDYLALHEQVDAITTIDPDALVADRQCLLTFGVQLSLSQLVDQAGFIRRLQQPRPQRTVYLNRGADDLLGNIVHHHLRLLRDLCGECLSYPRQVHGSPQRTQR